MRSRRRQRQRRRQQQLWRLWLRLCCGCGYCCCCFFYFCCRALLLFARRGEPTVHSVQAHTCLHTHAHMFLLLFHCFVCTTHTHTRTRMRTYNLCMRLCAYHVCPPGACVMRTEQRSDQAQTKVGSGSDSDSDCGRAAQQPLQSHNALPSQPKLYFLSLALSLSILPLSLSFCDLPESSASAAPFDRAPAGVDCRRSVLFGLLQSMIYLGIARQIEGCKGIKRVRTSICMHYIHTYIHMLYILYAHIVRMFIYIYYIFQTQLDEI